MINLNRPNEPTFYTDKEFTDFFKEKDYRDTSIFDALKLMHNYKCCFCEKNLKASIRAGSGYHREHFIERVFFKYENKTKIIEHLKRIGMDQTTIDEHFTSYNTLIKSNTPPEQNILWSLANRWDNLLLCCQKCGSIKLAQVEPDLTLINPSNDEIEPKQLIQYKLDDIDFISHTIGTTTCKNKFKLALGTIVRLKLNDRADLTTEYRKHCYSIDSHMNPLKEALTDEDYNAVRKLVNNLKEFFQPDMEFSALSESYIKSELNKIITNFIPRYNSKFNKNINAKELNWETR